MNNGKIFFKHTCDAKNFVRIYSCFHIFLELMQNAGFYQSPLGREILKIPVDMLEQVLSASIFSFIYSDLSVHSLTWNVKSRGGNQYVT